MHNGNNHKMHKKLKTNIPHAYVNFAYLVVKFRAV